MKTRRLEATIWTLIYGGLLALMLGLWARDGDAVLGDALTWTGSLLAGVGVVLIWLRSRLPELPAERSEEEPR